MPKTLERRNSQQMLDIVALFMASGGTEPVDLDELARFAINNGHWKKHTSKMLQLCKREFSQAFREQYHSDPQQRSVRTYHAVKSRDGEGEQHVLWADMRTAPGEHMEAAFQQRRQHIVGNCRQLKSDVDSFNDNNAYNMNYQLVLDFGDDVAECEQPTKYRPGQPR
jgi:hypothetical protein